MRLRHKEYFAAVIITFTLILAGCSVEKNTGASRFYNSLVSKYNIFFNGNEAYKAGVKKVQTSHRDDYSTMIPVFEYSSPESAMVASSEMDRAIQKASKVITMHSITARPSEKGRKAGNARSDEFYNRREYNEWVDDAYILMAKAYFYQKNFMAARSSFSFAVSIATDPGLVTEAAIWMARIQTEEGNYSEASRMIQEINNPDNLSATLKSMYYSTLADIMLRQKRFGDAVAPLTKATEMTVDKDTKVRLTFLLAQVCEAAGDNTLSTRYFRQVIRMNPSYELEFNAGINLAGVTDISQGDAADLKKSLNRMLRDSKNKDYLDQIYFALGELEKRMGNTDEAIKLWSQSAASSTVNSQQKARSYLALGEHYYALPEYLTASVYYDSASALIDERFPDYASISRLATDLGEYAYFHTVVITEDSLRRVAGMSAADRDVLIAGIIRSVEEEQARASTGEGEDRYNMGQYYENEQRYRGTISAEGGWYFYNQSALSFGRSEFRRRWGDRRLEDNWRRSNKARLSFSNGSTSDERDDKQQGDSAGVEPQRTKEYYLLNLPLTDSLMSLSLRKSAAALLEEGKVLATRLADTLSAASSFEEASRTGDDDNIRAEALYELYRLLRISDPARADRRRADLLASFPGTEYALILSDPDYVRKHQEMASRASRSYEAAYLAFTEGRYADTQAMCSEAQKLFPGDELIPKFMLLDAMAAGAMAGELAYKEKLDSLVARYPSTDEGKRAAEINEFLRREKPEIRIAEDTRIAQEIYFPDTLQPHFVMIIAGNYQANMNQIVFDVINYNLDNFADKNYRTEGAAVDAGYLLITTGPFANARDANAWLRAFNPSEAIRGAADAALTLYLISRDNLAKFREDKNIDRYGIFYAKEYANIR
ncbi:tetratricopeptide repeat protein [bacterium]|nr:tetratricopeptide repeat protein [bacterium]